MFAVCRASQGKHISMIIRFANTGRQLEDAEIVVHGNLTVGCMRKQILRKVKGFAANLKVELYANGEMLDPADDRRLISEIPAIKDKMVSLYRLLVHIFALKNTNIGFISVSVVNR